MLLVLLTATAHALDPVWILGGHIGTTFIPGTYPIAWSPKIRSYDFDADGQPDDVDGDTLPDESSLEKVRTDGLIGISGGYWVAGGARLGVMAQAGVGKRYLDLSSILLYDQTFDLDSLYALVGGGVGFASTTWRGADTDERLQLPNYPLRAEGGILLPVSDFMGLEAKLFVQMSVPARHLYKDIAGREQEISGIPLTYTAVGIQLGYGYGLLR